MKNTLIKLMVFMFLLNISVGFVSLFVVYEDANGEYQEVFVLEDKDKLAPYNPNKTLVFEDQMGREVNPSSASLQDRGDQSYMIIDMFKVGFLEKILENVKRYMFGFIYMMDTLVGKHMTTDMQAWLFGGGLNPGILYTILTIAYILAAWSMWTGNSVTSDE